MKYLFVIALGMFLGCNPPPAKVDDKTVNKSDTTSGKFQFSKNEDENNAFGPIRFGITDKEYNSIQTSKTVMIGTKDMYLITPFFNRNNELYKLQFLSVDTLTQFLSPDDLSNPKCYDHYLERFDSVIEQKYGKTKLLESFDPLYLGDSWLQIWESGLKKINLGIRIEKKGYRVICTISNKVEEQKSSVEDSIQNAKRAQEIKDSLKKKNPM
jgi:hypothetical protein